MMARPLEGLMFSNESNPRRCHGLRVDCPFKAETLRLSLRGGVSSPCDPVAVCLLTRPVPETGGTRGAPPMGRILAGAAAVAVTVDGLGKDGDPVVLGEVADHCPFLAVGRDLDLVMVDRDRRQTVFHC